MHRTIRDRSITFLASSLAMCLFLSAGLPGQARAATPEGQPADTTKKSATQALEKIAETPAKPVYPQTMSGAKQAFKDQNYQDALGILIKLEGDYAGKVEYDYLLGRCALATKQYDVAVAAFTRALTVDPNFAAARFELARTYYSKGVALLARGPFEQARSEFSLVNKMNPPAELKPVIAGYQANIDKYLQEREAEFNIFVEIMGGYDSNIGTQPSNDAFAYYDPYSATMQHYDLRTANEEDDSVFMQARTGAGISWPLFSKYFEVFGAVEFGGRSHANAHDYDHTWDQVSFGARHYGKNDKKTIRLHFRSTDIFDEANSRERYHEEGGVLLSWEIKRSKKNTLRFFVGGGDSRYEAHGTHVFSVSYNRQGLESTHLLEGKRKPTIEVMFVNGSDHPLECEDSMYCPSAYERNIKGLRFGWGVNIFDSSRLYTSFYMENSEYHNRFFEQQRNDQRREIFMGINTHLGDSWYLRPELHYTENNSNLSLFEHERWLAAIRLGWNI